MTRDDETTSPARLPDQLPDDRAVETYATVVDAETRESDVDLHAASLAMGTIDVPVLAAAVERQEAADAADTLEDLEREEAAEVLAIMEDQAAADTLAEMEAPLAESVLADMIETKQAAYIGRLLTLVPPDDGADLLQLVAESDRESILATLPPATSAGLRRLAGYDEETAAGLMTTVFATLHEGMTVDEATLTIREQEQSIPGESNYLPVVDARGILVGVIGIRTLLLSSGDRVIGAVMNRSPRALRADLDQETVAREFDRYDASMMPVVDHAERVIGIVTVDDVIDIIREEHTEDVQKAVGAGAEEGVYSSTLEKFKGRFPWLLVSLTMMVPSALIVLRFDGLIDQLALLAVLMPVVAAVAGNAGHQALAVTLRGIILEQVRPGNVFALIRREILTGVVNGLAIGMIVFGAVALLGIWREEASWRLGVVAGVSLAFSIAAGTCVGSLVPLGLKRFGVDPAQSSAIFLIMLTDAVSFASFLGLAFLSFAWLLGAA